MWMIDDDGWVMEDPRWVGVAARLPEPAHAAPASACPGWDVDRPCLSLTVHTTPGTSTTCRAPAELCFIGLRCCRATTRAWLSELQGYIPSLGGDTQDFNGRTVPKFFDSSVDVNGAGVRLKLSAALPAFLALIQH
jgi:hypothetical protein